MVNLRIVTSFELPAADGHGFDMSGAGRVDPQMHRPFAIDKPFNQCRNGLTSFPPGLWVVVDLGLPVKPGLIH